MNGSEKSCRNRLNFVRSEEHTSELQSQSNLVCRLLLETKNVHGYALIWAVDAIARLYDLAVCARAAASPAAAPLAGAVASVLMLPPDPALPDRSHARLA